MPLSRSFPIDSGFPDAVDLRRLDAGLIAREGVFPDPTTTAAAGIAFANGAWNVGARVFVAALKRGGAPYSLAYGVARVANDSQATAWTIPAAPVSGSRIDLLWIRATDPGQGEATSGSDGPGGAARAVPIFGVTAGTPSGTPATPALPAGALLIATVTTPSGAASIAGSTIVQSYGFAHLVGGVAYYRTAAALLADTANNVQGQRAFAIDSGVTYEWRGSAWVVLADDTGWVTASLASGWTAVVGEAPAYRRYRGVVYLRGRAGSTGAGAVAFTLPAGFRPAIQMTGATDFNTSGTSVDRYLVATNGQVGQVVAASRVGYSFGGIRPFIAEA